MVWPWESPPPMEGLSSKLHEYMYVDEYEICSIKQRGNQRQVQRWEREGRRELTG